MTSFNLIMTLSLVAMTAFTETLLGFYVSTEAALALTLVVMIAFTLALGYADEVRSG